MSQRTVFFISDGTGITAETFGNAILAQFESNFRHVRLPFTDSVDKAHQVVREINRAGIVDGNKPIVFTTLVDVEVLKVITDNCQGLLLDMFSTFVHPLESELRLKSSHRIGRFSDASKSRAYQSRIEAINFSLPMMTGNPTPIWNSPILFWSASAAAEKPQPRSIWPCNTDSRLPTTH